MKILHTIFILFLYFFSGAQQFSVHLTPGIMNYAGDLQSASYTFSQSNFCIGGGISYQENHFALSADFISGSVEGNDKYSSATAIRNLNFKSPLSEFSLKLQYNFLDLSEDKKFTPYIFGGIGITHFNPYTFDVSGTKVFLQPLGTEGQGLPQYSNRKFYKLSEISLPIGIGIQYKISEKLTAGIEYCTRYLNSDYLDDVSKTYPNRQILLDARGIDVANLSFRTPELFPDAVYAENQQRGNPKKKDNFYTSVFKLSYTFNSSNQKGSRLKTGNISCPKKV